ncbi:YraN family protein [bacterium]|nr:YraN family protein [bacterium]
MNNANLSNMSLSASKANKHLGQNGEDAAANYLTNLGYTILKRNFRAHVGPQSSGSSMSRQRVRPGRILAELDIIAQDQSTLVFVEVKTRSPRYGGNPLESITPQKQARMRLAAQLFLDQAHPTCKALRFDAIGLIPGPDGWQIQHIKNIMP